MKMKVFLIFSLSLMLMGCANNTTQTDTDQEPTVDSTIEQQTPEVQKIPFNNQTFNDLYVQAVEQFDTVDYFKYKLEYESIYFYQSFGNREEKYSLIGEVDNLTETTKVETNSFKKLEHHYNGMPYYKTEEETNTYYINTDEEIDYIYVLTDNNDYIRYELNDDLEEDVELKFLMGLVAYQDSFEVVGTTNVFTLEVPLSDYLTENETFASMLVSPETKENVTFKVQYTFDVDTQQLESIDYLIAVRDAGDADTVFRTFSYKYTFYDYDVVTDPLGDYTTDAAPNSFPDELFKYDQLVIGESVTGTYEYANDHDVYNVILDNEEELIFEITSDIKSQINIYDVEGNIISTRFYDLLNLNTPENVFKGLTLPAGEYYVEIYSLGALEGDYTIEMNLSDDDYSNVFTEELVFDITEAYQAQIDYIGDIDVFGVELQQQGFMNITVNTNDEVFLMYRDNIYPLLGEEITLSFVYQLNTPMDAFAIVSLVEDASYTVESIVYNENLDESNTYDDPTITMLELDEILQGAKHHWADVDYFKLEILEADNYNMILSLPHEFASDYEYKQNQSVTLYDEAHRQIKQYDLSFKRYPGIVVTPAASMHLEVGTYYVKVEGVTGRVYNLELQTYVDDFSDDEAEPINISTVTELNFRTDKIYDKEVFTFTLTEESTFTFSYSEIQTFKILETTIYENHMFAPEVLQNKTYTLPPGTYTLEVIGYNLGNKQILIDQQ